MGAFFELLYSVTGVTLPGGAARFAAGFTGSVTAISVTARFANGQPCPQPGLRSWNPPERRGNTAEERREFGSGRRVGPKQNDNIEDATHRED